MLVALCVAAAATATASWTGPVVAAAAGRPPCKAATPLDTILQVISDDPVPPTQFQSKTPRDLETICLKCLRKEPARRYADELNQTAQGSPVPADLAFLAMSRYQMGERDRAQAILTQLRETLQKPKWAQNEEAQLLLKEAEALLVGQALQPEK
jgi:hypothetical protein